MQAMRGGRSKVIAVHCPVVARMLTVVTGFLAGCRDRESANRVGEFAPSHSYLARLDLLRVA
jgi:hypothetical protein